MSDKAFLIKHLNELEKLQSAISDIFPSSEKTFLEIGSLTESLFNNSEKIFNLTEEIVSVFSGENIRKTEQNILLNIDNLSHIKILEHLNNSKILETKLIDLIHKLDKTFIELISITKHFGIIAINIRIEGTRQAVTEQA